MNSEEKVIEVNFKRPKPGFRWTYDPYRYKLKINAFQRPVVTPMVIKKYATKGQ